MGKVWGTYHRQVPGPGVLVIPLARGTNPCIGLAVSQDPRAPRVWEVSIELQRRVVNTIGLKEHAYDLVIFRLNVRSINANQVMQMILRVRNLNDKKIIFICDRSKKKHPAMPSLNKRSIEAIGECVQAFKKLRETSDDAPAFIPRVLGPTPNGSLKIH